MRWWSRKNRSKRPAARPSRRVLVCEPLESRMLLAADVWPVDADALWPPSIAQDVMAAAADQTVRHAPGDYPTIQAAINAARDGDLVLVAPGIHYENISLAGKSITLASQLITTGDPTWIAQTVIDGGGQTVIDVAKSAGSGSRIVGLTLQNGDDGISANRGVQILYNHITGTKDAIDLERGRSVIRGNLLDNNTDDGIDFDYASHGIVEDNVIRDNEDDGIEIRLHRYRGSTLEIAIRNNAITGNGEDGIQLIDYSGMSDRVFFIEGNLIQGSTDAGLGLMDRGKSKEDFRAASVPEPIYVTGNAFVANQYGITGGNNLTARDNLFADTAKVALKRVDGRSVIVDNQFVNNGTHFLGSNVDPDENTLVESPLPIEEESLPVTPAPSPDSGSAPRPGTESELKPVATPPEAPPAMPPAAPPAAPPAIVDDTGTGPDDTTATDPQPLNTTRPPIGPVRLPPAHTPAQESSADPCMPPATDTAPSSETSPAATSGTVPPSGELARREPALPPVADAPQDGVAGPAESLPAEPTTVTYQQGVDGYTGARDAVIDRRSPDANFGDLVELEADGSPDMAALLYWEMGSIAEGSQILSASITLDVVNKSRHTYELYGLRRGWQEHEVTYRAAAEGDPWQRAGGLGSDDRGRAVLGRTAPRAGLGPQEISLNAAGIALLQRWVDNPTENHGLMLEDYRHATDGIHFSSREAPTPSQRPQLTITYRPRSS